MSFQRHTSFTQEARIFDADRTVNRMDSTFTMWGMWTVKHNITIFFFFIVYRCVTSTAFRVDFISFRLLNSKTAVNCTKQSSNSFYVKNEYFRLLIRTALLKNSNRAVEHIILKCKIMEESFECVFHICKCVDLKDDYEIINKNRQMYVMHHSFNNVIHHTAEIINQYSLLALCFSHMFLLNFNQFVNH